jgi:GAF domain-containing protein
MSGESFLQSPTAIGIAVVVAIVLIALIIFLFLRQSRNKSEDDRRVRSELDAMERENKFAAAADDVRYARDPNGVANDLARVIREHLAVPVIAIYAGRENDNRLAKIFDEPSLETPVPDSIPAALARDYRKPQVTASSAFKSEDSVMGEETLAGGGRAEGAAEPLDAASRLSTSEAATTAPLEETAERDSTLRSPTGPASSKRPQEVLVIPWRGPFDWSGLIMAQTEGSHAGGQISPETLARFRDPLARLSDRLAVALEFEREHKEALALDDRASRTLTFSRSLISCLEEPTPLASITREVTRLLDTDSAALWRVEPDSSMVRMVAAYGLRSAEFLPLPVGQGLAGSVAQSGEPLALEDAPSDPRCIFPREARESGIGSYLGVPVNFDDRSIGVIEVHTTRPRKWTEGDRRTLRSASLIISEILRNTDARGKRLRVESAYLGLSEALQRLRTPGEVMDAVVEVLGHALAVSRAFVVQFDDRGMPAPVEHEYHVSSVKPAAGATFAESLHEAAAASANGDPIVIADSRQRSLMDAALVSELEVLSEVALPMKLDDAVIGVICLHQCDRVREWHRDEIEFADRVARQLALSLSNVRSLDKAAFEATAARENANRASGEAHTRIGELEQRLAELERALADARNAENHARSMLAKASAAEAKARAEADIVRRSEAEARLASDQMREEVERIEASSRQLLETNRVKSEFIVNAGHEIEASLQSVLGLAELLVQGSYGPLAPEQDETVRGIYTWARRIKSDVDLMIEYGSMRSRRLDEGEASR